MSTTTRRGRYARGAITVSSADSDPNDSRSNVISKRFPQPYQSRGDEIALTNLTLNYSWRNVTERLGNVGGCAYRWIDQLIYEVPYPAGYYTVATLSGYLRNEMLRRGHFLVSNTGEEVTYLELNLNSTYYAVTLTSRPVPTVLPEGWKNPNNIPLNGKAPTLIIRGGGNKWGDLIGYAEGEYPPNQGLSIYETNGTKPPIISPVTAVNVTSNWSYDGRFDIHANLLGSFVPQDEFGSTINYQPSVLQYFPVTDATYTGIEISFFDQNFNPLDMIDRSQIQIQLSIQNESMDS